ncbi:MAG: hypothetical protein LW809_06645 [Vampirovibrionales bacterium]|jgi:hypothetical protein|nr:hypothetical protein [Vampirovibrionales bacterium]
MSISVKMPHVPFPCKGANNLNATQRNGMRITMPLEVNKIQAHSISENNQENLPEKLEIARKITTLKEALKAKMKPKAFEKYEKKAWNPDHHNCYEILENLLDIGDSERINRKILENSGQLLKYYKEKVPVPAQYDPKETLQRLKKIIKTQLKLAGFIPRKGSFELNSKKRCVIVNSPPSDPNYKKNAKLIQDLINYWLFSNPNYKTSDPVFYAYGIQPVLWWDSKTESASLNLDALKPKVPEEIKLMVDQVAALIRRVT